MRAIGSINDDWDDWKEEIDGEVKSSSREFNHEQIEELKDDLSKLTALLQKVFGYAKARAQREYKELKETVTVVFKEVNRNRIPFLIATSVLIASSAILMSKNSVEKK